MFHLIPAPLHRAALRIAFSLRSRWRALARIPLSGVMLVSRDESGAVLLVRHSYGPDLWSLPGGGCGRREEPSAAARREMQEELGVVLHDLVLMHRLEETLSGAPHTAYIFTALVSEEPQVDGRELLEARFFSLDALPEEMTQRARRWIGVYRDKCDGPAALKP